MATDTTPHVFIDDNVKKIPSDIDSKTPSSWHVPSIVEDYGTDVVCWHLRDGATIASFLVFDAASRQKQTNARIYRAKFAVGCYMKFAKKLQTDGKMDPKLEISKPRDVRFKWIKARRNTGEWPAYKKVAEVKL